MSSRDTGASMPSEFDAISTLNLISSESCGPSWKQVGLSSLLLTKPCSIILASNRCTSTGSTPLPCLFRLDAATCLGFILSLVASPCWSK
eukprot:3447888-Pyramimonas_sp.AAC.1